MKSPDTLRQDTPQLKHAPVSLVRCGEYNSDDVQRAVNRAVEELGGIRRFVKPGDVVLLKPNQLVAAPPEKCVCTHPEVLRAVIRLVQTASPKAIWVGDSPGVGSTKGTARKAGLLAVIEEEGAALSPFTRSMEVSATGGVFKHFQVAPQVVEADVIINLPKVKTHSQMVLTLAIKNIFGCVVGGRKPGWHLKAGRDYRFFARMLLDLHRTVAPALNIVDGVMGMEGDGPGNGTPVELGFIAAGSDAVGVDVAISHLLGVDPAAVYVLAQARQDGYSLDLKDVPLVGEPFEQMVRPVPITLPQPFDLQWKLPGWLKRRLTSRITARPRINHLRCKACGQCVEICPPDAMSLEGDKVVIDYSTCIRCYCCQEICPEGAIDTKKGLKLLG